jgi:hypothetical protein
MSLERRLDLHHWYTDDDCWNYLEAAISTGDLLEGRAENKTYLLKNKSADNFHVFITPSANGQKNTPPHTLSIDYFLNKKNQPDQNIGAFDVFDEIKPLLRNNQKSNFRILFPCNLGIYDKNSKKGSGSHWILGEIEIVQNTDNSWHVKVSAHDPLGEGKMTEENYNKIKIAVEERLKQIGITNICVENAKSPYKKRQSGMSECGVIVCDDLIKRAKGQTLDIDKPYEAGAPVLRQKQVDTIKLLTGVPTRIQTDAPRTSVPAEKWAANETLGLLKSAFSSTEDKTCIQEKDNGFIVKYKEDEIAVTRTQDKHQFTIESKNPDTLREAVRVAAAMIDASNKNNSHQKIPKIIQIETEDEKIKKVLIDACKEFGITMKLKPSKTPSENKSSDSEQIEEDDLRRQFMP